MLAAKERNKPMNTTFSRSAVLLFTVLLASAALAQSDAQKSFDKLKTLVGSWQGKNADGKPVQISFRDTAGGTALMSEITAGDEDMISMIHLDGDRLLLTHYCPAGNQPRMKASVSPDGKTIMFDFVDATNLSSPEAGHMQRAVFTFLDADHHSEEWDYMDHGKGMRQVFELQRAK
jgi:hypothetical protein